MQSLKEKEREIGSLNFNCSYGNGKWALLSLLQMVTRSSFFSYKNEPSLKLHTDPIVVHVVEGYESEIELEKLIDIKEREQ